MVIRLLSRLPRLALVPALVPAIALAALPQRVMAQDEDVSASTDVPRDLDGHWALIIDDSAIFVFDLSLGEGGEWQARWMRPAEITTNGVVFSAMDGMQEAAPLRAEMRGPILQLVFPAPNGAGAGDVLQFAPTGENTALLRYVGVPTQPYPLVRVNAGHALGPFEGGRIYDRDNAATERPFEPDAVEADVAEDNREEIAAEVEDAADPAPEDADSPSGIADGEGDEHGLDDGFLDGIADEPGTA